MRPLNHSSKRLSLTGRHFEISGFMQTWMFARRASMESASLRLNMKSALDEHSRRGQERNF